MEHPRAIQSGLARHGGPPKIAVAVPGGFSPTSGNVSQRRKQRPSLWKSVKYEEVYLHAYESVAEAHRRLARYFTFDNQGRPHSALDVQTPDMVYFAPLPQREAA